MEKLENRKRIDAIQFLRFIAMLFVFYTHITYANIVYATCGVSFFVVLSGFLYGCKTENKDVSIIQGTYFLLKNKISKFYLLHLVTLILSIPFEIKIPSMRVVVKNLFLLQCFSSTDYFAFNGVSWFLSLMLVLSILTIPLKKGIVKIAKIGNNKLLAVAFIFIVTINFSFCFFINQMDVNIQYWLYVCPIVRILEYAAGMIVGYIFANKEIAVSRSVATGLEIFCLGIIGVILSIPNIPQYIHRNFIWVIPMCLLIYIFAMQRGWISKCFSNRWFVHLGNITFEMFMTHQIVLRYVDKHQLLAGVPFGVKFIVELVICIILAELVSRILKCVKIEIGNVF